MWIRRGCAVLVAGILAAGLLSPARSVEPSASLVASHAPELLRKPPRALPYWPHRVVGRLPDSVVGGDGFLVPAQLDGRGGKELIAFDWFDGVPGEISVTAYTYLAGRFRSLGRARLRELREADTHFAAGDLDGDGRDELYLMDPHQALVTVRLTAGGFRVRRARPLVRQLVASMEIADVRRTGRQELLVIADRSQTSDTIEDPENPVLLCYRRARGRWVRTWRQAIPKPVEKSMGLLVGDFLSSPGLELVVEEVCGGIEESFQRIWWWNGNRFVSRAKFVNPVHAVEGEKHWSDVATGLVGRERAILSGATYYRERTDDGTVKRYERGELLLWRRGRPRATYRLPGAPGFIADVFGTGRPVLEIHTQRGGILLVERRSARASGIRRAR